LSDGYIELERTFHELSLKVGDNDEFDYRNLRFGKNLRWSDLLAEYRTVILSEAGAGKTEEIRHAAQSLRQNGKSAFFLRLEHVADDFEISFEEGNLAEFEQWLASGEKGWVFLDSVDEARLREPTDFERAIRKIGVRLSSALQRSHIVITSRGTAWRPVTDLKLCQKHLRHVSPTASEEEQESSSGEPETRFRIVALDDLGRNQVEIFAKARGLVDPKPLMEAIERADAWSMAARPDDLNELIEYWEHHERIGNRLELMQASIARRLAERDQNREEAQPLSTVDAHKGARSVAAAATMTQTSTIRVPDGSANTIGIAVAAVLPDWDAKKCAALLARPIFDEAIYQTVRFHHRTVREYLTAEWLKELLDRETSRRKIEALLFREQYGQDVIVPTMRPVLVWLILLDDKIRERALAVSPELIFEGGEPKALPLATRQTFLRDVCETLRSGILRSSTSDYRAVQRFADKDIAADVKELCAKYRANDELQWFLMRMIWQGELTDALPEAKHVAMNPKGGRYARIAAFRAVRAIGSDADMLEVRDHFLNESQKLGRDWFAELIEGLPPTEASIDWVVACIEKAQPKERHRVDGLPQALDAFGQSLSFDLLSELLTRYEILLSRRPIVERRFCEISSRYGWLMKSATVAAERLITARHPAALQKPVLSVLQKLPSAQQYRDWDLQDIRSKIPELVSGWPELNHALFWYEVGQARRVRLKRKKEPVTDFWQVSVFGSYWQFGSGDFDRILADVSGRSLPDDRRVALSLAFRIYVQAQRPRKWLTALKGAVARFPLLRSALHGHLHPSPPTPEQKQWRRQEAQYERQRKRREAVDAERERKWKEALSNNIDAIRNPQLAKPTDVSGWQYHLHERMRQADTGSTRWTEGNWRALIPAFGEEIARAFRDGAVAYWRRYRPKLRSEGKAGNSTPFSVIFGLTGLSIEARETPNWASTLDESDAELAFRYAMDELNGFPEWMPSLFDAYPNLISALLLREVDRDLRIETVKVESHYVLSDLSWSGAWAYPGIGTGIFARLKAREPKNLTNLGYMLNIIHDAGIDSGEMAHLAALRSCNRSLAHAARWYAVWTGIEPEKAISALEARLKTIKGPVQQTRFAMLYVTHLLGGRRSSAKNGEAFRKAEHLRCLYTLMHQYIREEDDIQRAGGGVFSPGLRDDAQDARNQLFSLLKEIPGKEAYLALMELAHLHPEPSSRPWMKHHAKAKAEQDADLTPWTIAQTREFESKIERTPSNHRELFELSEMHFLDLKDNLEHGDSSIADILIKGATKETDMRKYIGEWLRHRAQSRYTIPQEEELADDKRIDLRVHGNGFDAPVPVELKLSEKWTGPELFERLENQLCGDYLRDNRSNRGLFVLVYRGQKASWELPHSKKSVTFTELLSALQAHWHAISSKFPGVDDIRVIGIDLTRRSSKQ
jgi:hypothetical protein